MEASTFPPLLEVLRTRARASGAAPAFVDLRSGEQTTYERLYARSLALAAHLQGRGIERNAVVAVVANDPIVFPLLAACSALEAQLAIIDASLHPLEIVGLLEHAEPKLVVTTRELVERLAGGNRSVTDIGALAAEPARAAAVDDKRLGQGRLIIYTSGSTGSAKGVVLSERALAANAHSVSSTYGLGENDRLLCVLPFYHMNALMMTGWAPLWVGATVVVAPLFSAATARSYWATTEEHGITVASLTPSIMSTLLKLDEGTARRATPKALRYAWCGAAPLRADLWKRFEEFIGVPIYQGYGLTETTCWAAMIVPGGQPVHDAVGVPVDCEVRIAPTSQSTDDLVFERRADGDGAPAPTPTVVGEVEIRGPLLMDGYYRNKTLTRETFTADGFLRTGDLGFVDEAGLLHIAGRRKEVIIKSGVNIVPEEIDTVLRQLDGIADAKSIGLPDDVLGELVCSVCVMKDGVPPPRPAEVRRFVGQHLAAFKCPDRIVFAGHIPKTPTGKPRVGELRQLVSGELASELLGRLDTWKFKRAHPSERDRILALIQAGLLTGRGTTFVAYWGCGKRDAIADPDREAMDRLHEYVSLTDRPPYAMSRTVLILTDVHAGINGKGADRSARYFADVAEYAKGLRFETVCLSELWKRSGLDLDAFLAGAIKPAENPDAPFASVRDQLVERAEKHSERDSPEAAARKYYDACQLDSVAVVNAFQEAVFLTYNGPDARFTLPRLPTMYVYSYKRKRTEKPWFM
jgi:acyl-CoA synthetase (AMP-forming)/AMP-acid ligase II